MASKFNRKIVLEDGSEYYGYGFGADRESVGELVFNTSMAGYQEVASDPAHFGQMVVMTYPLIGNFGVADEDLESKGSTLSAIIVREYNDLPSNFRYTKTLSEVLEESRVPGIYGIDTRKLTRHIRDLGTCRAVITNADTTVDAAIAKINSMEAVDNAIARVSCEKRWYSRTSGHKYNVVAIDCGIKVNTVRGLNGRKCNVTVVPYNMSAEVINSMKPDGVFVSSGPGNPEDAKETIETIKMLIGKYPIFGVGLGCQLIALAYGAECTKMKFGHHGTNHPVKNITNGKIEFCTQNHTYVIDKNSLDGTKLKLTHENVLDGTVEGVACDIDRVFGILHEPSAAPVQSDGTYNYDKFINFMKEGI